MKSSISEKQRQRIFVIDTSEFFVRGFSECITSNSHLLSGYTSTLVAALSRITTLQPDCVVIGPNIDEIDAYAYCRRLAHITSSHILLFCAKAGDIHVQVDAIDAGADACLPPDASCSQCQAAILAVIAGHQPFSRETLYASFHPPALTIRETDILRLMAQNKGYAHIAHEIGIAPTTARNYAQKIIEKLDVHCREDAVRRAMRRGIVDDVHVQNST